MITITTFIELFFIKVIKSGAIPTATTRLAHFFIIIFYIYSFFYPLLLQFRDFYTKIFDHPVAHDSIPQGMLHPDNNASSYEFV